MKVWLWLPRLLFRPRRLEVEAPTAARRAQLAAVPFGVNVVGYITGTGSLGEAARLAADAFKSVGVPVSLYDQMMPDARDRQALDLPVSADTPFRVNLMISGPSPAESFAWKLGRDYRKRRYNIGFWPWEYPDFPLEWQAHFHDYDEVWAPSFFAVQSLARSSPVPVALVPHPVRTWPAGQPKIRSRHLSGLPTDAFIFLFAFSHNSFQRKNPAAGIEAFKRAFSPLEEAWYVIKSEFSAGQSDLAALRRVAGERNILFLDAFYNREELDGLMASCDCYVSLHHAEGFGLTLAEAMAMGKPVIATNYSGNLDFMTASNSYLVDYEMRPSQDEQRRQTAGQVWAEPNVDDAARHMRYVFDHRDEAGLVGERARADIQKQLSLEAVGELMKQRLLSVAGA